MRKQNAGERKRTVTVVVGPKTEDLMNRLNKTTQDLVPWKEEQRLTGLLGAALNAALSGWRTRFLKEGNPGECWNHFD